MAKRISNQEPILQDIPRSFEEVSNKMDMISSKTTSISGKILGKNKLKVSCFGDSITNGYGQSNSTFYTYPNRMNHLLAKTDFIKGSNLFSPSNALKSAGCTESGGVFTFDATSDANPRFALTSAITITTGKFYLLSAELDSTNSVGLQLALRIMGATSSGTIVGSTEYNVCGFNASTGGYKQVYYVISADYLMSLDPTIVKLQIGAELVTGSSSGKIGLVRNIQLYEIMRGVAVHNQGVDGDNTTGGIVRLPKVKAWNPDICIIGFGTNDIRQNGITITKEQYVANVKQIADSLNSSGIFPIIANIPVLASDQTNYSKVPEWNDALKVLANKNGYGYWDRYNTLDGDATYLFDGRHPNADGYYMLSYSASQVILGNKPY